MRTLKKREMRRTEFDWSIVYSILECVGAVIQYHQIVLNICYQLHVLKMNDENAASSQSNATVNHDKNATDCLESN